MVYHIYCITNKLNNKSYVGQTQDPQERWAKHIYDAFRIKNPDKKYSRKFAFQNAIAKYGENNFHWQIIDRLDTLEEANEAEEFYIAYLGTQTPNGYNILPGGKNRILPASSREKISETLKRTSFFVGKTGPDHPNFGRQISQKEKDNLSIQFSGDNGNNKKINSQTARQIYLDYLNSDSISAVQLGKQYGLGQNTILNILNKKSWKDATKDLSDIPPRQGKRR
jgi:group I intron endonuclease